MDQINFSGFLDCNAMFVKLNDHSAHIEYSVCAKSSLQLLSEY